MVCNSCRVLTEWPAGTHLGVNAVSQAGRQLLHRGSELGHLLDHGLDVLGDAHLLLEVLFTQDDERRSISAGCSIQRES